MERESNIPEDNPEFMITVEDGEEGRVNLVCKSSYGDYETTAVYPLGLGAAIILSNLLLTRALLKSKLIGTDEIEEENDDNDD